MSDADRLAAHLADRYSVEIAGLEALDIGVFRVDRSDGPSWVARVFPPSRPLADVEGDAAILRALERAGFPAERCAHNEPVSTFAGGAVLVSEFIESAPPLRPGRSAAILGALLGRLHTHAGDGLRAGGAWHHLSFVGGPREEIAAARELLEDAQSRVGLRDLALYHRLCDAVERTDDCHDLSHSFVHPDFVLANAIPTAEDRLVIVDWAGSGRGPRLWSIGFLLWSAGARSPKLVELVASRYRRHIALEDDELERLAGAIRARPLMLECWSFCVGRRALADAVVVADNASELAERIASQARRVFAQRSED